MSDADLRQMIHERDLFATALGDLLVAIDGATAGMPLTGPQLLMLAEDATLHHKAKADSMERCEGCPAWLAEDQGHTDVEGARLCDDCWPVDPMTTRPPRLQQAAVLCITIGWGPLIMLAMWKAGWW